MTIISNHLICLKLIEIFENKLKSLNIVENNFKSLNDRWFFSSQNTKFRMLVLNRILGYFVEGNRAPGTMSGAIFKIRKIEDR